MLRIIQNTSAASAKSYYASPSMADYYTRDAQELGGIWRGKGAARLGLAGSVQKDAWDALCDNRNPTTGEVLTPRQNKIRRVGNDFNFHVPKSVSLVFGLTGDQRILDAFRASVDETMRDMEANVETRVRKGGKNEDRVTRNLVWGEFVHTTARPVEGIPDPHLHAHCFVMNLTFDETEDRWKAAQFGNLKRDASFYEAAFHTRFSSRLAELGFPIERTRKGWELAGVSRATLDNFSRRRTLIEKTAVEQEAKAEKEWREALARGEKAEKKLINKFELGARTRERKQKDRSTEELRREWMSRLSAEESEALAGLGRGGERLSTAHREAAARAAAEMAIQHLFERKSVVPERQILIEAMKRSYGRASLEQVTAAVAKQNLIIGERDGQRVATTEAVLAEEKAMLAFARNGRGDCRPLGNGPHTFKRDWLNEGQRNAVNHVLASTDRVILIAGRAGTGKTKMMAETVEAIEANGTPVLTVAPSADASRGVLQSEGFTGADTVARLLIDENLQRQIQGGVIWVDEASLLGTRTMGQVFGLAEKLNARVILSGDIHQHGSINRGAALRLLETEAGLTPATLKTIQRQKGAYKSAVAALSEGDVEHGFHQLDQLGWIKEVGEPERYRILAREYVAAVAKGKSAIIVSPTHLEGDWINHQTRLELKRTPRPGRKREQFLLGSEEREFTTLRNAHLTAAQKRDAINYRIGSDTIEFHQNAKDGFGKGTRLVAGDRPLPLRHADKFSVFHTGTIRIAPGELIRITQNGKSANGEHRLNNGSTFTVAGFTPEGDIRLTNGWKIDKAWGHFTYAYAVTSHASQGRTVDKAFVGVSAVSYPASSPEMMYVASSRAREQVVIFTDDKRALLEAVKRSDDRQSATELAKERETRERIATVQRMQRQLEPQRDSARDEIERGGMNYER